MCLQATDQQRTGQAPHRTHQEPLDGLPPCGFGPLAPADGAFYVYAGIAGFAAKSPELCAEILQETGVAVTPGTDFDPDHGEGFIRFSYAGSSADMRKAVGRLARWAASR